MIDGGFKNLENEDFFCEYENIEELFQGPFLDNFLNILGNERKNMF